MKYDYLIVGAGFFGSVFAREMTNRNKKCLIIDCRNHIGGNAYSYKQLGIDVHKYGPHIFHTNNKDIWNYVNKYSHFLPYFNRGKVLYNNKIYSFPINLETFNQLWGVKNPEEARKIIEDKKIKIKNPQNLEEYVLSLVGEEIYEIFIKGYTTKQWGKDPKLLPISIIKRIPIRFNFMDYSTNDIYSGVPEDGYDVFFNKLLKNIDVELGTDYFNNTEKYSKIASKIVYTGCVDKFFDYKHGILEYRSLKFENQVLQTEDFQGNALVNYTDKNIPHTRICEHKHFLPYSSRINTTIITKEYPQKWTKELEPYYPINDDINNKIYDEYLKESKKYKNIIFGGRLGSYKYYDMHQVVASALTVSKKESENF